MARLEPYFPKKPRQALVDDRQVLSGIIFVNRNGLPRRDAYGPHKSLYNRWKRWSEGRRVRSDDVGPVRLQTEPRTVMIDATYLKTHPTARLRACA